MLNLYHLTMQPIHLLIVCLAAPLAGPIDRRVGGTTACTSCDSANSVYDHDCAPRSMILAGADTDIGTIGTIIGPSLFILLSLEVNKHAAA